MKSELTLKDVTPEIIDAVADYLVLKAKAEVLREEVDKIERELLKKIELIDEFEGFRITEPKDISGARVEAFTAFYEVAEQAKIKAGIKPLDMAPGFCPALVAESAVSDAEEKIITETLKMMDIDMDPRTFSLKLSGARKQKQYIDTVVKLVLSMPSAA